MRALSFNEDRCLWVNVKGDSDVTLDAIEPTELEDCWPEHRTVDGPSLPQYLTTHDKPCRTCIALPLTYADQKLGVIIIEFDRRIPCTPSAKLEVDLIRAALARILWLQDTYAATQEGTRKALDELKDSVIHSISSVDPPRMFFAFPGHSDVAVTAAIKKVLTLQYGNCIQLISWDQMSDPGLITDHTVDAISRCRYGICYLSEINTNGTGELEALRYVDNPNVLIEAGMLDVLVHNRLAPTIAWIPVRESDNLTVQKPFDFVSERMITVPRGEDGAVQQDAFEEMICTRVEAMLAL